MSQLFLASASIHDVFRRLLIDSGGIAGLIDVEGNTFPLLADPTRSIEITEEDFPQEEISRWTVQDSAFDRYLELIMEKVEAATAPDER